MDIEQVKAELEIRGYEVELMSDNEAGLLNIEGRFMTFQDASDLLEKEMEAENR